MSNYNSERGTIKIPSAEIVSLRREIVKAYNAQQERLRSRHNSRIDRMRKIAKEKGAHEVPYEMGMTEEETSLFYRCTDGKKVKRCTKKALDLPKISEKKVTLSAGELYVTIDTDERTLTWDIDENNRAVERAYDSFLGKTVMSALRRVNWTRGSGGRILYQDEYQRDAYAGPSVSKTFGPK